MDPYQMPVCCSVCGEEGLAKPLGSPYLGDVFTHRNPHICIDALKRKHKKLIERTKETIKETVGEYDFNPGEIEELTNTVIKKLQKEFP